ncbi:MAG: hypothetical protein LBR79_00080 [Oscillospiraceae bacterium]|nr:hypothetical protein [Oscillospiraceae bacterium]
MSLSPPRRRRGRDRKNQFTFFKCNSYSCYDLKKSSKVNFSCVFPSPTVEKELEKN